MDLRQYTLETLHQGGEAVNSTTRQVSPTALSYLQGKHKVSSQTVGAVFNNEQALNMARTLAFCFAPRFRGSGLCARPHKSYLTIWSQCLSCSGRVFRGESTRYHPDHRRLPLGGNRGWALQVRWCAFCSMDCPVRRRIAFLPHLVPAWRPRWKLVDRNGCRPGSSRQEPIDPVREKRKMVGFVHL